MITLAAKTNAGVSRRAYIPLLALVWLLPACAELDPREADVELEESLPEMKVTNYTEALHDLGLMTEIYGTPTLRIQCNPVGDNTGTSASTGGEIPRDITEIMKSSLNAIGGKVVFIPYDPSFMQNQVVTGYSNFAGKVIPDVVLTGGITEFDRGLVTIGKNTDISGGGEIGGIPDSFPSKDVGLRYSSGYKGGLASITLDFNLLDFQTMTGIPRMNTTNSMKVRKALRDQELGVSLFGQSFGGKGSIKKVQGRHAAVRLVVELSMIQIVGKHLRLPYWRLLGKDTMPDKMVIDGLAQYYQRLTSAEITANVQEWLYLYGHDLDLTGRFDEQTKKALVMHYPNADVTKTTVDFETFANLYFNIPLKEETKRRREAAGWN